MKLFNQIIIIMIIYIIIKIFSNNFEYFEDTEIKKKDDEYLSKFSQKNNIISKLLNNNQIKNPLVNIKKNKILIITFDNRPNEEYIVMHNNNVQKYCKKWGYEYKFYDKCNYNIYWCKIYMVLDALKSNNWDYVMWLDSDTIIKDFDLDLGNVLNNYSSDIFAGSDNIEERDLVNAGIFIIKNSHKGRQYLQDCINSVSNKCINEDKTLNGIWAGPCYEQGAMNLLIVDKYSDVTTLLPNNIVFSNATCSDNVFIMHKYGSTAEDRVKCFSSK